MTTPVWDPPTLPVGPERAAPGSSPRIAYLPGLDGLRAVALIGVMLFHAEYLRGAFLSVDLFFVLSGFLITSLLLAEWDASGRIDLKAFWSRRLRRLLPAALVVLAAVAVYAVVTMDPGQLDRFRSDALAALFDVANWRAIRSGADYWASFGTPSPLRHMWTLSVEEQLYVAWPVVAFATLWVGHRRRWGRQALLLVAIGLALASMTAMALLVHPGNTDRAYYGTDTRASAVLLGAAAAILLSRPSAAAARRLATGLARLVPVALVVLAVAWVWADGQQVWTYRWVFPTSTLSATVLVAGIAAGGVGWLVRILEWRPLRELGRLSYGAYLWHWPIFVALEHPVAGSRLLQNAVRFGLTLVAAVASSRLVERPLRGSRVPTRVWRPLALAGVALVAVSIGVATLGGKAQPVGAATAGPSGRAAAGAPSLLLLGDSEAYNLELGEHAVLGDQLSFAYHARIGCGTGPGLALIEGGEPVVRDLGDQPCTAAMSWLTLAIDQYHPQVILVHEGAWDVLDRQVDGKDLVFGTTAWDDAVRANQVAVLQRFAEHGARVVALAAPCYPSGGEGGGHTIRDDDRRVIRYNQLLRQAAATTGAQVLPYDQLFCGVPRGQQPARSDGVHLTQAGAEQVWRWLAPRLGMGVHAAGG